MVQDATTSKPAQSSQLGQDEPPSDSMVTACSHDAPLTERALQRHYSRQEPSAVVPHAGICAGGRSKERSLPRSDLSRRATDTNILRLTRCRLLACCSTTHFEGHSLRVL
jgi:hypothetical protein